MDKSQIRDAATIILLREDKILMGQRGNKAAFLPNKFVFPGGAVDPDDAHVPLSGLDPIEARQLVAESLAAPATLAAAAIRELWEETGQILGRTAAWPDAPKDWRGFAKSGYQPDATGLQYFFRAVTPEGRPRRFDARFFLVDAQHLATDPDHFDAAHDELSDLQWIAMSDVRRFDLPFITQVVLAELSAYLRDPQQNRPIPFFRNDDEAHLVTMLNGDPVL